MPAPEDGQPRRVRELWQKEVLARHRWGRHGDRGVEEVARLQKIWEAAQPLDQRCGALLRRVSGE